ncbi:MAG: hypothetical protein ACPGDB_02590 [Fusobacterium sp.]
MHITIKQMINIMTHYDVPKDQVPFSDETQKELNRKKVMDDYFNSLPKEKQRNIMEEAYAKAKKEYGCIWEVMGRTKVKYEILKKYLL